MKTILFNESTKLTVLRMFDKTIDEDGFIIEVKSRDRVLAPNGTEVKLKHFAGIRNGSEIFITDDLPSLIEYGRDLVENNGMA